MSTTITAKEVNELRQKTGAGIMDCKKALTEANGDLDAAIDFLRKKGQKVSELRAGREAKEGVVIARTSEDGKNGYVLHLSSETDFVSRNEEFINFANDIVQIAMDNEIKDLDALHAAPMGGVTVKDKVSEKVSTIGELIAIVRFEYVNGDCVVPYIHAGYKIGVLVNLNQACTDAISAVGKDVAMQIAAMNPVSVSDADVPEDVKEREMAIGREQALAEGKPAEMVDRIAEGKLNKFYKENTLLNQQFVKDGSMNVAAALKAVDANLTVKSFTRVALG